MNGTLEEIAAIVGTPGAKAMCAIWGGQRFYVPKQPAPGSPIVLLLGELLVQRLAARFGGDYIELPRPDVATARRVEARRLRDENFNLGEIAARLGVGRRRVFQILADE